jgi:hypothetical protein
LESQTALGKCTLALGDSALSDGSGTLTVYLEDGDSVQKFHATFEDACSLPAALRDFSLSRSLSELLGETFQLAVNKLVDSFVLGAFRSVPLASSAMAGDLAGMLDCMVDKAQAGEQLKQVIKVFANPNKTEYVWPSAAWRVLVEQMMAVIPTSAFSVALPVALAGAVPAGVTSKEVFSDWISLHDRMAQVAMSYMFLRARYFGNDAEPCCCNGMLKPDAVSAVETVRGILTGVAKAVVVSAVATGSDQAWLDQAATVLPCICRTFVDQQLKSVGALADEVGKVTPKYDHVVTTETVHMTLAKKHLLGWPSKDVLNSKTVLLHHALQSVRNRHAEWQFLPPLSSDKAWADDLASTEVVFDSAKQAIGTIAAINVIFMPKGKDQVDAATAFLLKNRDRMAKSLVAAMEKIVATHAAQAPAAKKARTAKAEA